MRHMVLNCSHQLRTVHLHVAREPLLELDLDVRLGARSREIYGDLHFV
jgi:hypothetical protein